MLRIFQIFILQKVFKNSLIIAGVGLLVATGMTSTVNATSHECSPQLGAVTVTPTTISKEKPSITIKVTLNNLKGCNATTAKDIIGYVAVSNPSKKLVEVNLGTEASKYGAQSSYTVSKTIDVFKLQTGAETLKQFTIIGGITIAGKDNPNTNISVSITNSSGTQLTAGEDATAQTGNPSSTKLTAGEDATAVRNPGADWDGSITIKDPTGGVDIFGLITKFINWLLLIVAMLSTLFIIYGGIIMVFSNGAEEQIKSAKSTIFWALAGMIVALGAFTLVNLLQTLI